MERRPLSRRALVLAGVAGAAIARVPRGFAGEGPAARLAVLEREHGGRLGVAILDSGNGRRVNHRGEQRFALCSTAKLLLVGLALAQRDRGQTRLDERVVFESGDLVAHSPATQGHAGAPGMRLDALCEAAMTVSDNTAANLLLARFGGPAAVTAYARSLGDAQTRLDRIEPMLNENLPGDPRDTTTPAAMLAGMRALLLGDALLAQSRMQLLGWMSAGTTGARRLRAGVPSDWAVAGKTGTGLHGATNEVALLRPPGGRAPLLAAVYYDAPDAMAGAACEAVIAGVGRIVAGMVVSAAA